MVPFAGLANPGSGAQAAPARRTPGPGTKAHWEPAEAPTNQDQMRAALGRGLARKPPYLFRLLCVLVAGTALLRVAHFSAALAPPPARLPAHQLFETLARAVVAAGAELVLLQGATGGQSLATGAYPDGSPERHTVADGSSAAVLRRVALAFPGLAVVDEEEVAAAAAAGGAGAAARGWRPTQQWQGEAGSGGGGGGGAAQGAGAGADASALHAAALRSPTLPVSELSVFLDPLDASQEYSEGLVDYVTVAACVARCGVPIVGLVYQPFQQRLYWTRPGTGVNVAFSADGAVEAERALAHAWGEGVAAGGACCSRRAPPLPPLPPQQQQPLAAAAAAAAAAANASALRVLHSRSHSGRGAAAALAAALPPGAALVPAGGAGYKFIQLLEGAGEAYVHPGSIRKWDVCAGEALLRAAGGGVAQWSGAAVDYCLPALPEGGGGAGGGAGGAGGGSGSGSARTAAMEQAVRVAGLVAARTVELGRALGEALRPGGAGAGSKG